MSSKADEFLSKALTTKDVFLNSQSTLQGTTPVKFNSEFPLGMDGWKTRLQICPLYIFGNNPPQMVKGDLSLVSRVCLSFWDGNFSGAFAVKLRGCDTSHQTGFSRRFSSTCRQNGRGYVIVPRRVIFKDEVITSALVVSQRVKRFFYMSNEKSPGWLGYIGDYTTQLYRDYKPL